MTPERAAAIRHQAAPFIAQALLLLENADYAATGVQAAVGEPVRSSTVPGSLFSPRKPKSAGAKVVTA